VRNGIEVLEELLDLKEYEDLFVGAVKLHPHRCFDLATMVIKGSKIPHLKPYCYPPTSPEG